MKKTFDITKSIVQRFELAPEAVGCLRVTLIDNTHAFIENHRGVIEYTQRRICVRARQLNVTILGQGLVLDRFGRENVAVRGDVFKVEYEIIGKGAGTVP